MGLKSRDLISLPLDIPNVDVSSVPLSECGDYSITVEGTQNSTICQHCGHKIKFHGHGRWIELRHLSILGHRVYIRLRPKQYECSHCDDRTTTVNWDEFDELGVIGIDEIALTKGRKNFCNHHYSASQRSVAVLAVLPDHKKKTVRQFLETIPKRFTHPF